MGIPSIFGDYNPALDLDETWENTPHKPMHHLKSLGGAPHACSVPGLYPCVPYVDLNHVVGIDHPTDGWLRGVKAEIASGLVMFVANRGGVGSADHILEHLVYWSGFRQYWCNFRPCPPRQEQQRGESQRFDCIHPCPSI